MNIGRWKAKKLNHGKKMLCVCCLRSDRYCWHCSCGFHICQECMNENLWGMTCNNITWVCPDCGRILSF
jgi:hypothetical protein